MKQLPFLLAGLVLSAAATGWFARGIFATPMCDTLHLDMSTGRSLNYYIAVDDAHKLYGLACQLGRKQPSKADVTAGKCPKDGK